MGAKSGERLSRAQWAGFFALCLLGASGWLVSGAWPSMLTGAVRESLHDLMIAIVLCAIGWRSSGRRSLKGRPWRRLALASICLLGVPALVVAMTFGEGAEVTVAALFALLPVMVIVIASYVDFAGASASGATRLLVPALIGLGGMLLLLPFAEPGSWRQVGFEGMIVLGIVVAAVASVWMYRLLREFTAIEAAVIFCLANALFSCLIFLVSRMVSGVEGVSGGAGDWSWRGFAVEAATALCFGLPQVVLLVWLMREIVPTRFAARYLVIPLLTVIEGCAVVRPEITLRTAGGAVLVIFGAWRLLTASQRGEEPGLMLR